MLGSLRKWAGGYVAAVFIFLLAASFAVFGIGDVIRGGGEYTVATVGDVEIDAFDFRDAFERERRRISQQTGREVTIPEARSFGLDARILDDMINRAALDATGNSLGLTTPDPVVRDFVHSQASFQGLNGTFDQDRLAFALSQMGMSELEYVETVRQEITRNQLIGALRVDVPAPRPLAKRFYEHIFETRDVRMITLDTESVPEPSVPDDTRIATYYEANETDFIAPEYRGLTLVKIHEEAAMARISITDEQIQQAYEERLGAYTVPERRQVYQFVFPDEAAASAAVDTLRDAESLDAALEALAFTRDEADLGFVTQEDMIPGSAAAAFALEAPGVAGPVALDFGFAVVQVTEIEEGSVRSLEDVSAELRDALARSAAREEIYELAIAFDDERAAGVSLEDAAKLFELPVEPISAVDRRGLGPDGARIEGLPNDPQFLQRLFDGDIGAEEPLEEAEDGSYYVFRLDGVQPSDLQPLDAVRDEVIAAIRDEDIGAALDARIVDIDNQISAGRSLDEIATDLGLEIETFEGVQRDRGAGALRGEVLEALFAAEQGDIITGPAAGSPARLVVEIADIAIPSGEVATEQIEVREEQLGQLIETEMLAAFLQSVRETQGVEIRENGLETAFSLFTGP